MWLTPLAVASAAGLDIAVGEPPGRVHPVALLGRLVAPFDRHWRRPLLAGVCVSVLVPALSGAVAAGLVVLAGEIDPFVAAACAGLVLFVCTSLRRLVERVRRVGDQSEADIASARSEVRALVGRERGDLSAGQIRSAACESLAENFADGLLAPLIGYVGFAVLATFAGSDPVVVLATGAAGGAWVKGVNTLDSMLGYRSKPVGRASARLDDLVMWVPARLAAGLLALVARDPGSIRDASRWLSAVPSPNSGWPMGVLAAILDVRFEKPGAYVLNQGRPFPGRPELGRANQLIVAGAAVAYTLAAVIPGVIAGWC